LPKTTRGSRGDVTGFGFADGAAEPEQDFARWQLGDLDKRDLE